MPAPTRVHGWLPDVPDARDLRYRATLGEGLEVPFWQKAAPCLAARRFPPTADLLQYGTFPFVYDQGSLGSCTAQAVVAMDYFVLSKEGEKVAQRALSRLMLYGESRDWSAEDTGASLRNSMKALARVGLCLEEEWPYRVGRYTERPPATAYAHAAPRRGITYARLSSLDDMLHCLSTGFPFVFGFGVYPSFYDVDREDPVARLPRAGERLEGGHAVCAVGYDLRNKWLKVRNSWGADWGMAGHFFLPFEYVTNRNLADDFWALRSSPVV